MFSPHLRVTARCLRDDLLLSDEDSGRDARSFRARHDVLRAFVNKREGAPAEGEPIQGLEPHGAYLSLHHSRWRGVTRWDASNDVCWLLAFSPTHASGELRDAYNYFQSLHRRDELLPTADDYELLEDITPANFIDGIAAVGADLYRDARSNPRTVFTETYGGGSADVVVDVLVMEDGALEEGWIAVGFPFDTPLNEYTALDVVAHILPRDIMVVGLERAAYFAERPLRHDELVFKWDLALI